MIQNADDNSYPSNVDPLLRFTVGKDYVFTENNEVGFSSQNVLAICNIDQSTKHGQGQFHSPAI
jgi:hypothetical protein